jgi:cell division protease FtsH
VSKLIDGAHDEALSVLTKHRRVLDELADALIEHETLDTAALTEILEQAGVKKVPQPVVRRAPGPARETKQVRGTARRTVRAPRPASGTA